MNYAWLSILPVYLFLLILKHEEEGGCDTLASFFKRKSLVREKAALKNWQKEEMFPGSPGSGLQGWQFYRETSINNGIPTPQVDCRLGLEPIRKSIFRRVLDKLMK